MTQSPLRPDIAMQDSMPWTKSRLGLPHHELHPLGDVTLQLGRAPPSVEGWPEGMERPITGACTVLASTTQLSAASPVFRAMFTPNTWLESNPSTRIVPLPDDHPAAMLLLVQIAHLRFLSVRDNLSRFMLYQLAVICDKYDCLELVAPWLQRWVDNHQFGGVYHAGDAFICWTFGLESVFEAIMKKLIMETSWNEEAGVLVRHSARIPYEDEIMPGDALESVRSVRNSALKCIDALLKSTMGKYKSSERRVCKGLSKYDLCDAAVFGCFMRSMQGYILHDIACEKDIPHSIEEVAAAIGNLRVVLPERGHYESRGHEECDCGKSLRSACAEVLAQLGTGVTDEHRRQLRQQAAKCGSNAWASRS